MAKVKRLNPYIVFDKASRIQKANTIIKILEENEFSNDNLLDIGTGSGFIAHELSKNFKKVLSIDIYDKRIEKRGYKFKKIDDTIFPLNSESFDVVISNHVIEHVQDQLTHIKEINRVLKKDGICYLSTPNRFWFFDPHTKLPFISWLPRRLSESYLFLVKKEGWELYPLSITQLYSMLKKYFQVELVTTKLIKYPDKYCFPLNSKIKKITNLLPMWLIKKIIFLSPTYNFVLKKKPDQLS